MTFSLKIKPIKKGYVVHEVELYHGDELLARFLLCPEEAKQLRALLASSDNATTEDNLLI